MPLETMAVDYYEDEKLILRCVSLKDVCDKIIHANTVTKPIFKNFSLEKDEKISFQLKGSSRDKLWALNLCLELYTEIILKLVDEIERHQDKQ